jgi:excisionase family DNA binding protein
MSSENTMAEPAAPAEQPVRDYENKRQFAARLGISLRTVDNLLAKGLPHIKITRKLIRIPRIAADEWLSGLLVRRA